MEAKPVGVKGIVRERMQILFALAEKEARRNPERSRRYVALARKLGTRFRLRMPPEMKRRFCRKCGALWVHGRNVKARLKPGDGRVVYHCECGARKGFPFSGKKKAVSAK